MRQLGCRLVQALSRRPGSSFTNACTLIGRSTSSPRRVRILLHERSAARHIDSWLVAVRRCGWFFVVNVVIAKFIDMLTE